MAAKPSHSNARTNRISSPTAPGSSRTSPATTSGTAPPHPGPPPPAGGGTSLERRTPVTYADDPLAWKASFGEPSPGFPNDGNRTPTVDAGPDAEIESSQYPFERSLTGSGADDGLPVVPGRLTFAWSQVSGPGRRGVLRPGPQQRRGPPPRHRHLRSPPHVTDGERSRSDEVTLTTRRPGEQRTLIAANSVWRYLDDATDPGTAWRTAAFNDSAWKTGAAELGYGDGDERTQLTATTGGVRARAFFFRRAFTVANPSEITALKIRLVRDDGALVYLNGTLVFRSNMPEGPVNASTFASQVVGDADESAFFEQEVDPALLIAGNNLIAVQVHQVNAGSSDVGFNLALDAVGHRLQPRPDRRRRPRPDRPRRRSHPASTPHTATTDCPPNPVWSASPGPNWKVPPPRPSTPWRPRPRSSPSRPPADTCSGSPSTTEPSPPRTTWW
jgi:hypothetical protein